MVGPAADSKHMKKPERIGPYYLLSPLGDSGRGNVWLARAGARGDRLALKLVREGDSEGLERLMHECSMAMGFDHPNIVRMHECGEANGVTWISMGYVSGPRGELTLANFRQLLLAMVHVHANDVIHTDIRDANLLLDENGDLRLAGFGMARKRSEPNVVLQGKVQPLSPEQLDGQSIDHRTDIFALGMVLYQVLTGKAPFQGSAFDVMQQVSHDAPAAPSSVAPGLGSSFDELVRRAMASNKEERYGSVFEFLSEFDAACRRGVRASA